MKKEFGYTDEWYKGRTVCAIIDNAPTVESDNELKEKIESYKNAYKIMSDAFENEVRKNQRPQGEWIISQTYDCHSDIINIYTCPFCGAKEYSAYPFCHCGAKMKGGAE